MTQRWPSLRLGDRAGGSLSGASCADLSDEPAPLGRDASPGQRLLPDRFRNLCPESDRPNPVPVPPADHPIAVALDLVHPARPVRHGAHERGQAWRNEAARAPSGRRGAPQHGSGIAAEPAERRVDVATPAAAWSPEGSRTVHGPFRVRPVTLDGGRWFVRHLGFRPPPLRIGPPGLGIRAFLVATAVCCPASAAELVPCFTPGEDSCAALIAAEVAGAKTELLVQAYGFTSAPILHAIADAKARGVEVRVILDRVNDRGYSGATFLLNHGVVPLIDDQVKIAHNKVIVIDVGR
jgi:phosphatidylserine/phosphatidylglycerophosphate/cardiolipin synthase-like enzyme